MNKHKIDKALYVDAIWGMFALLLTLSSILIKSNFSQNSSCLFIDDSFSFLSILVKPLKAPPRKPIISKKYKY